MRGNPNRVMRRSSHSSLGCHRYGAALASYAGNFLSVFLLLKLWFIHDNSSY